MPFSETILLKIGDSVSKLLLKNFFGDTTVDIGNSLIDISRPYISEQLNQRKAKRQFEDLGDKVAQKIIPLFEHEATNISVEAVIYEVALALENNVSAKAVVECGLDPKLLSKAFKDSHVFPVKNFSRSEKNFYERILEEIARYVIEICTSLPKFDKEYSTKCLFLLENMAREIERTLHVVESIQCGRNEDSNSASSRYEIDYRQTVIRNLDYMELYGADISHASRRHVLSAAYVSLNLEKPDADEIEIALFESILSDIENSKSRNKRILIRGEAGSGKSTLLRWAAIEAAKNAEPSIREEARVKRSVKNKVSQHDKDGVPRSIRKPSEIFDVPSRQYGIEIVSEALTESQLSKPTWVNNKENKNSSASIISWAGRIPFLVRLRDCDGLRLPRIEEFPSFVARGISEPPSDWVDDILKAGRGIIFIDGVDEVSKARRRELRTDLVDILGRYPNNMYVITTRPTAVPQDWLASEKFIDARINPLSRIDRIRLIEKWHRSHSAQGDSKGLVEKDLSELESKLIYEFDINPHISRIASNPLLCAMICALHKDRSTKLPESLSQICEDLCHALLHRRELDSGLTDKGDFPEAYSRLNYPQKKMMVSSIAHYMTINQISVVKYKMALIKIRSIIEQIPDSDVEESKVILDHLIERSGIVRKTRPERLDFIHNSFKEYLAASIFVENEDIGLLTRRANEEGWQPVVRFAAATHKPDFASDLIRSLLHESEEDTEESFEKSQTRRILALQCKYVAQFVAPELVEQLIDIEKELIPPATMQHAEILAASGDSIIPLLSQEGVTARQACASIRTLRLIGSDAAKAFLKTFLDDERVSVISELSQAVEPLSIKSVRKIFIQTGGFAKSIAPQVTSLEELLHSGDVVRSKSINLSGTKVNDLSPITDLSHLRHLSISGSSVKDLNPIANLYNLEWLNLSESDVIDLAPLRSLKKLRVLLIRSTCVENLSALEDMENLMCINISKTRVSDLSALANLISLEIVYTSNHRLVREEPSERLKMIMTLSHSAYFNYLQDLNISGVKIDY